MKTVMITGANSGLGFETARKVAKDKNDAVILACRNMEKAESARQRIIDDTGNQNISVQKLDTSDLTSVRDCVKDLQDKAIHLDVLLCNAGIAPTKSGTTADSFELVFATNYLGHYLLTMLLLPSLNPHAQIIHVTSDMHNPPMGIKWKGADYLAYHAQKDKRRYSYSKLCNILFTYHLSSVLKEMHSTITVNCFNPGFMVDTNFSGGHHGSAHAVMVKNTMPERYGTLESSSTALASLVTDDTYAWASGAYFDRTNGIGTSSELSHDQKVQEELWTKSQEYTDIDAAEILKTLQQ